MKKLKRLIDENTFNMLAVMSNSEQAAKGEIRKWIQLALSDESRKCVDSIHFILCRDDDCDYEREESIEGCWEQAAHIEWTNIAAVVLDIYNITPRQWFHLLDDYIDILAIANKSDTHAKMLLTLCHDPIKFLHEVRSIVIKDDEFSF